MNISILVGRLTKDAEFTAYTIQKTGKTGYKVRGTIAVDRKGTGKNGQKETDFIPIQSWISESQKEKYHGLLMKKGALVSLHGYTRVENYEDKETKQRKTFTVAQGDIQVLVSPQNGQGGQGGQGFDQNQNSNQGFEPSFEPSFEPAGLDPQGFQAIDDDDIPF